MIDLVSIDPFIRDAHTPDEIRKKLREANLQFHDVSKEFGYFNLRIPMFDGYFRIYEDQLTGGIRTQRWRKQKVEYSGIPTFEPSGRRSL